MKGQYKAVIAEPIFEGGHFSPLFKSGGLLRLVFKQSSNFLDFPNCRSWPKFHGLWKRPSLTPCHHVDLETGMGPMGARICFILTSPVCGNSELFIIFVLFEKMVQYT